MFAMVVLVGCVRAAPEVLRGEGYGRHTDWWSLGNLVCQMLFGSVPHTHTHAHAHAPCDRY